MRDEVSSAGTMYNLRPQVLRANRTAEGTQNPTSTYSKYKTFKEAYNAARKIKICNLILKARYIEVIMILIKLLLDLKIIEVK